jgi:hypothetical protein
MCCRHFVAIFGNPFSHAQDRARMRIDCRMIGDPGLMSSVIPARFTPHGSV